MTQLPEIVEILDEDLDLGVNINARPTVMNTDGWEESPGLGFYIGDGIYIKNEGQKS